MRVIPVVALAVTLAAARADAQARSPGSVVLERMRAAYAGKWYKTLTFVQRTIVARASGVVDTTTWYESISGVKLRIDIGAPTMGNGILYTPDSSTRMRGGVKASATPSGNVFLPLIMGVYLQPLAETERQARAFHFDLDRSYQRTVDGRATAVVGATAASDTLSPQFWVDVERNVVIRVTGTLFGTQVSVIDLGGYERVGQGWLATRVSIVTGAQRQTEEYSDWKAGMPLADALFDPAQWTTAPHWVKGKHSP